MLLLSLLSILVNHLLETRCVKLKQTKGQCVLESSLCVTSQIMMLMLRKTKHLWHRARIRFNYLWGRMCWTCLLFIFQAICLSSASLSGTFPTSACDLHTDSFHCKVSCDLATLPFGKTNCSNGKFDIWNTATASYAPLTSCIGRRY